MAATVVPSSSSETVVVPSSSEGISTPPSSSKEFPASSSSKDAEPEPCSIESSAAVFVAFGMIKDLGLPDRRLNVIKKIFENRERGMSSIISEHLGRSEVIEELIKRVEDESRIYLRNQKQVTTAMNILKRQPNAPKELVAALTSTEGWLFDKDGLYEESDMFVMVASLSGNDSVDVDEDTKSIGFFPSRHTAFDILLGIIEYVRYIFNPSVDDDEEDEEESLVPPEEKEEKGEPQDEEEEEDGSDEDHDSEEDEEEGEPIWKSKE